MADERTPEQRAADQVIEQYLALPNDPAALRRAAWQYLLGAAECLVLIPAIFWLRFHDIGPIGWGVTIFLAGYCVLTAIGLTFRYRPEYHTTVKARWDWKDRVGAFWLVAVVFGPFIGWLLTELVPVTADSWRIVYGLRALFAVVLPLLTALPLIRYVRGKAALISLPILVIVTVLPVSTGVAVMQDLLDGPRSGVLAHTGRPL